MGRIFWLPALHGREEAMLTKDQWTTIHLLRQQGHGIRALARDLGVARNTVRAALQQPEAPSGQRPRRGGGVLSPWQGQMPELAAAVNFNAVRLYQDLTAAGYAGGYETVKRAVRTMRREREQEAVLRYETPPGKQAQVDWGSTLVWFGSVQVRAHAFVYTLGYSRRSYVEWALDETLSTFLTCHHHAFEHFGGMPAETLYDNPRTVVAKHDAQGKVLEWHPVLADALSYYGITPRACPLYRAQTKGKVESGVKYVKGNFLPNRQFDGLADLNGQTWVWLAEISDQRVHGTTHERPIERFAAERTALLPLGSRPAYVIPRPSTRQVAHDGFVEFQANRYSVPPRLVGQAVHVWERPGGVVEIEHRSLVVATHPKATGRHQLRQDPAHRPGFPGRPPARPPEPPVVVRPLSVYEEVSRG